MTTEIASEKELEMVIISAFVGIEGQALKRWRTIKYLVYLFCENYFNI
jgi:hypothetical protein